MKVVYIHGLGSDGNDNVAEALRREFEEFEAIEYYEISERPGWMEEAFNHVYNSVPEDPHILVGHSLGGLLAVYSANEYTKALVLLAPALSLSTGLRLYLFTEVMREKYITISSKHPVRMNKEDVDTFFRLMKDPPVPRNTPTLILLAEEDNLINNRGVYRYFNSINNERSWFLILAAASHNFSEREEEVARIVRYFTDLYLT